MGKAIVEIEQPKRCKDCVWYQADPWFGGSCKVSKKENGWNKQIGADEEYNVQKWCPLIHKNDAIPVEWIKEWIKTEPLGIESLVAPEHTIETMLRCWEKENETSRCR